MTQQQVILGKITGVHGIQGWLKVYSYTRPPENIFRYNDWQLQGERSAPARYSVQEHKIQGKKFLVKLRAVDDRNLAEALEGLDIAVDSAELPVLENEYYWHELIGLRVLDLQGNELGRVTDMMETGSNDVLLLANSDGKSLAIPWLPEVVKEVDLEQSILIADWEPLI